MAASTKAPPVEKIVLVDDFGNKTILDLVLGHGYNESQGNAFPLKITGQGKVMTIGLQKMTLWNGSIIEFDLVDGEPVSITLSDE